VVQIRVIRKSAPRFSTFEAPHRRRGDENSCWAVTQPLQPSEWWCRSV